MLYVWHSCIEGEHFVLHPIIEYYMLKVHLVKTRLAYHIAYYKSTIKSLLTLYSEQLKENTLVVDICRYLLLH